MCTSECLRPSMAGRAARGVVHQTLPYPDPLLDSPCTSPRVRVVRPQHGRHHRQGLVEQALWVPRQLVLRAKAEVSDGRVIALYGAAGRQTLVQSWGKCKVLVCRSETDPLSSTALLFTLPLAGLSVHSPTVLTRVARWQVATAARHWA